MNISRGRRTQRDAVGNIQLPRLVVGPEVSLPRFGRLIACWVTASVLAALVATTPALGAGCRPDALGVERVIAVDPKEHTKVGTIQYSETLPLADHEVVLTFDDGPSPRYTGRILAALDKECVKATFFMVGEMAKTFPSEARKVKADGHTVGTHSFSHPFTFGRMTESEAGAEIDKGVDAVGKALGSANDVAPFFRVPGFLTSKATEAALASRGIMTWSADVPADDWKPIGSDEVVRRAISRLTAKGRGILLLHDIHERTVVALPAILAQLKLNGFKVVQVIPSSPATPKTMTTPDQWKLPHDKIITSQQVSRAIARTKSPTKNQKGAKTSKRTRIARPAATRRRTVVRRHSVADTKELMCV